MIGEKKIETHDDWNSLTHAENYAYTRVLACVLCTEGLRVEMPAN